eukprot:gnl/Dysnectes_brevis/2543_a3061_1487.p1 GENE.gnl/Dysnectes_brevis/2543_a3061_1487~~gnl/Dysnectes_brevis/2543_a3061_1487.p1  ORF type:complete len:229 (-),score=30.81 gnl/Dysnectes_brevis/2543_a3061_1487:33-719(-)
MLSNLHEIAIGVAGGSIILTLIIYQVFQWPGYLSSISEAGAGVYPLYSIGLTSGCLLLTLTIIMVLKHHWKCARETVSRIMIVFCYISTLVMMIGLIGQAIIPIEIEKPIDIHRQLAGVGFLSSFVLCVLLHYLEKRLSLIGPKTKKTRSILAFILIADLVANMVTGGVVVALTLSVDGAMNASAITVFAILQWVMVGALFMFLYTTKRTMHTPMTIGEETADVRKLQ